MISNLIKSSLSTEIEIILIEEIDGHHKRLNACKKREWFWQNQLKTLRQYGGMNVREENF